MTEKLTSPRKVTRNKGVETPLQYARAPVGGQR